MLPLAQTYTEEQKQQISKQILGKINWSLEQSHPSARKLYAASCSHSIDKQQVLDALHILGHETYQPNQKTGYAGGNWGATPIPVTSKAQKILVTAETMEAMRGTIPDLHIFDTSYRVSLGAVGDYSNIARSK